MRGSPNISCAGVGFGGSPAKYGSFSQLFTSPKQGKSFYTLNFILLRIPQAYYFGLFMTGCPFKDLSGWF